MNKRQRAKRRRQRWEVKRSIRYGPIEFFREARRRQRMVIDAVMRTYEEQFGIAPGSAKADFAYDYEIARVPKDPPEVSYDFNVCPPRIYYSAGGLAVFERLVAVDPPTEVSHDEDCA